MSASASFGLPASPARTGLRRLAAGAAILAVLALWLLVLGRPLACTCGTLRFFVGDTSSPETSKQIADWYSALHVVFGFGLWMALHRLRPHWPSGRKFLVVLASAAMWEGVENIPFVAALFADPPGAAPYAGDSVVNALADTLFVLLGAVMAKRLPLWSVMALAFAMEALVVVMAADGYLLGTLRALGLTLY